MRKGIVKCLRVQGAGKRTFVANDPVSEDALPTGIFEKLVKEGKISETTEVKADKKTDKKIEVKVNKKDEEIL